MEMGTMDNTLLHDQGAEGFVGAVEKLTRIGARSTSETMLFII